MNKIFQTVFFILGITLFLLWCTSHGETDDFPVKQDGLGRIIGGAMIRTTIQGKFKNGNKHGQSSRYRVEVLPVSKPEHFTNDNQEFSVDLSLATSFEMDCFYDVKSTTATNNNTPIKVDIESATNTVEPFMVFVYDGNICVASHEYRDMQYLNIRGKEPEIDVGTLELKEK